MADWPLYTWDGGSRRYKDARGRFVPRSDVRAALDAAVDAAQADMLTASRELQAGSIDVGAWQGRMAAGLKRSHVMAAALAKGGWAQADSADWRLVAARVRSQYGYLRDFAYQVADGLPLDGAFLNRAGMYANSAIATYERVLRIDDLASGDVEERRLLHSEESCGDCVRYAGLSWQPGGTLPDIGVDCACLTNCRCSWERRGAVAMSSLSLFTAQAVEFDSPPVASAWEPRP